MAWKTLDKVINRIVWKISQDFGVPSVIKLEFVSTVKLDYRRDTFNVSLR
jgi:hypothetical protein